MSLCLASKFGAVSVGIATLAQVVPADTAAASISTYEKYGWTGLLILVVIALWIDGKREAAKAEERRAARDAVLAKQHDEYIAALNGIRTSMDTNAAKCDATRTLAQEALKKRACHE